MSGGEVGGNCRECKYRGEEGQMSWNPFHMYTIFQVPAIAKSAQTETTFFLVHIIICYPMLYLLTVDFNIALFVTICLSCLLDISCYYLFADFISNLVLLLHVYHYYYYHCLCYSKNIGDLLSGSGGATCEDNQWECQNGQCIDSSYRCDDFDGDCDDRTDEEDCP